jgi:hypothetical protein
MGKPSSIHRDPVTVNGIIYGEPGSGKTIFCADADGVLIADADFGTESAALHGLEAQRWDCAGFSDLNEIIDYVENDPVGKKEVKTLVLDSGSLFQERALHDELMTNLKISKPERNEFVPDIQQYLVVQNQLSKLVRRMCALPVNFIMTAYPEDFDLGEKQTVMLPMLAGSKGKYANKICGYMNLVGYLGVNTKAEEYENTLLTRRTGRYYAKNRFSLPPKIKNPSLQDVLDMIQATQEAAAS